MEPEKHSKEEYMNLTLMNLNKVLDKVATNLDAQNITLVDLTEKVKSLRDIIEKVNWNLGLIAKNANK